MVDVVVENAKKVVQVEREGSAAEWGGAGWVTGKCEGRHRLRYNKQLGHDHVRSRKAIDLRLWLVESRRSVLVDESRIFKWKVGGVSIQAIFYLFSNSRSARTFVRWIYSASSRPHDIFPVRNRSWIQCFCVVDNSEHHPSYWSQFRKGRPDWRFAFFDFSNILLYRVIYTMETLMCPGYL